MADVTDTPPIPPDELARLKAIAEDPLIAPSKRVEARTILKAWRRAQDEARDSGLRRRLQAKIRDGEELSWRERIQAQEMGLLAKRAEG